jgi:hypothetical protein
MTSLDNNKTAIFRNRGAVSRILQNKKKNASVIPFLQIGTSEFLPLGALQ